MKLPQLRKQRTSKNYHGITINDDYAWVDQPDILEVLKDSSKLLPEVKKYVEENNNITEQYFAEIKSKIKLDDTSLKFKDKRYFYWTKTTAEGNYGKKLRQLIVDAKLDKRATITTSFGVAQLRQGESAMRLSIRADNALYQSKDSGKNRISS